jgi:hypothetical protein
VDGFKIIVSTTDPYRQGIKFESESGLESDSCTVRNCELTSADYNTTWADGILVGPRVGVVIDNNTVHGFGAAGVGHGIYIQSAHSTITNNTIYDNMGAGIHQYFEGTEVPTDSNLIAYNVVYDHPNASGILVKGSHNWIHDNISRHNGGTAGIYLYSGTCHGNEVSNNVVYGNHSEGGFLDSQIGPNRIRNNIVQNNDGNVLYMGNATDTLDYNCYYPDGNRFYWSGGHGNFAAYRAATGQDAHSILADPLFVDTAAHDFHLQDSSPCIDRGDPATTPGYDLDGVWRPQGAAADMGAYEHGASVVVVDVGVTAIISPPPLVTLGTTITPQARVKNYGTAPATFPVEFALGTLYADIKTVTNLVAGDSALVSFRSWKPSRLGTFATRCMSMLLGDQNRSNDTQFGLVWVQKQQRRRPGFAGAVVVYDVTGRLVLQQTIVAGQAPDLRGLKAGVYIVKVTTDGFGTTERWVIRH